MALKISNDILTLQLRQVLLPGSNVTFDTSNTEHTIINANGGGGSNPDTLKIFDPLTIYPPNSAPAYIDKSGNVYGTRSNSKIYTPKYATSEFMNLNMDLVALEMNQSSLPLITLSGTANITTFPTVNGAQEKSLELGPTDQIASSPLRYANPLNCVNDCTLVFVIESPDQSVLTRLLSFSGTSAIHSMDITSKSGKMLISHGEDHRIPMSSVSVYVIRISNSSSIVSTMDVFLNGSLIYSAQSTLDFSNNNKSLGIGGHITIGSSLNTVSFNLIHLSAYRTALSDSECISLAQQLNHMKNLAIENMGYETDLWSLWSAHYNPASNASDSVWTPVCIDPAAVANTSLSQLVLANRPTYSLAEPLLKYTFSAAVAHMSTALFDAQQFMEHSFSVMWLYDPSNVAQGSPSFNEILSLVAVSNDKVSVCGHYTGSAQTLGLFLNGTEQSKFTIPNIANANTLLISLTFASGGQFGLTSYRYTDLSCDSCSLSFSAQNQMKQMIVGRSVAAAENLAYRVGDVFVLPFAASVRDAQKLIEYIKNR